MNLGIVVRRVHRQGGVEAYAQGLVGAWLADGHRVTVYAETAELPPGAQWRAVPARRWWTPRGWAAVAEPHDAVVGLSRVGSSTVFRAAGGSHRAWEAARGGRKWSDLTERLAESVAVRDARRVVANAEAPARALRAAYPGRRVDVVRNGVDGTRFRPDAAARSHWRSTWGVGPDARIALFVGNGFHRKGLDTAADAFVRASRAGDRLVVVGRDREAAAVAVRLQRRLGAQLIWVGVAPDTAPLFAAADALLLPTRYDSASNAVLEALSTGLPAVASAADGSAELVPEHRWVASDPQDVQVVATALHHAWQAEVPHGGARAAVADFTPQRNARALLDVVLSACQEA